MSAGAERAAATGAGTPREELVRRLQERAAEALRAAGGEEPFALLDFPDHRNVGDSAIWLGETAYFRRHRGATPGYVASIAGFSESALRAAVPHGPLFLHGGGNFGDLYPRHQEFREHLLERFRDREIVQLPQSVHFARPERMAPAMRAVARHPRCTLLVRDRTSYEIASERFDCDVRLCPDMAFFLGPLDREGAAVVDVLYLLRTDRERAGAMRAGRPEYTSRVADWLTEDRLATALRRLVGAARALRGRPGHGALRRAWYDAAARARTGRGRRLLSAGRVVVTDRLHAHIMCLLLGIPHAVLDNSYGKIHAFLAAWTGDAPDVHRAASMEDAEAWALARLSGG